MPLWGSCTFFFGVEMSIIFTLAIFTLLFQYDVFCSIVFNAIKYVVWRQTVEGWNTPCRVTGERIMENAERRSGRRLFYHGTLSDLCLGIRQDPREACSNTGCWSISPRTVHTLASVRPVPDRQTSAYKAWSKHNVNVHDSPLKLGQFAKSFVSI